MKEKLSKGVILSLASRDVYCKQFQLSALPQREEEEKWEGGGGGVGGGGKGGMLYFYFPSFEGSCLFVHGTVDFPASFDIVFFSSFKRDSRG